MTEKRKRRFGDRCDGRRLRTLPYYNMIIPFIMKVKNDANNYFQDSADVSEAEKYLRYKRLNGYPGMGMLHLFVAAYVRVVSQYPGVNRFVGGQRIYAANDIVFVMSIKKEMTAEADETSIKVHLHPGDTIDDVYRKLNAELSKVKQEGEDTHTDDIAGLLMKIPRLVLKFTMFLFGILEYFGKIPKTLVEASPFHGSMIITDLGSIGLPPLYHHLYNFGNMPLFVAMGPKRKERYIKPDGSVVERKYIDYKVTTDERICDGFYFSQAFKFFKGLIRKPQVLEEPPEQIIADID